MTGNPREHLRAWLDYERTKYADLKFDPEKPETQALLKDATENPQMRANREGEADIDLFIKNYLGRVSLFGLDTPQGRQAMGKLIVTLTDHLERAILAHGPMPKPGVTSGQIEEWDGDTHAR